MGFQLVILSHFNYCGRSFDQAPTLSLRGPAQFTHEARSAEFTGRVDGRGIKSVLQFSLYFVGIQIMYMYTCIYSRKLSPTFLWLSKFDVKLGVVVKNFNITISKPLSFFGLKVRLWFLKCQFYTWVHKPCFMYLYMQ